jgi:DNA-binding transcriptional LysR family regulator
MDLKQLRYFITVAEEQHFGRAAAKLHLSQPPLSLKIKQLEQDLGVTLLERTTRSVTLTDAGHAFLLRAKRILQDLEHAKRSAQQTALGMEGRLELGFVSSATLSILPPALKRFRQRYPAVELEISELTSSAQLDAIRTGKLRIGIIRLPLRSSEVRIDTVYEEPLVVAMPVRHPLSKHDAITPQQLAERPLIFFPQQLMPELYAQLLTLFQRNNSLPRVSQHAVNLHTIIELVASELGLAIVPASAAWLNRPGIVYKHLDARGATTTLGIARLEQPSIIVDNFIATLQDAANDFKQYTPPTST